MTITFFTPEDGVKAQKAWKEHATPCYLKKTTDPLVYSVCTCPGVDPIFTDLFIVEQCLVPKSKKKVLRLMLKNYSENEQKRILREFINRFDHSIDI